MLLYIIHSALLVCIAYYTFSSLHYDYFIVARSLIQNIANASTPNLEVFQVYPPVEGPFDVSCNLTLMVHSFAFSYGRPYVGESASTLTLHRCLTCHVALAVERKVQLLQTSAYTRPGQYVPPKCAFNRVVINLTVESVGRQFDRLGLMYFNDTEIFRTSTAEPTATGIEWTFVKDVSNYLTLFRQPQKIIFDLGNLVDNTYTAAFNTTLIATFSTDPNSPTPADVIVPISAHRSASNATSAFRVPQDKAANTLALPRNVERAVFTISACGQADEEFWWSNVLSSDTRTFPNNTLLGSSPFRELQLYIDGMLAGVAWPFPVIFTGGVVPGFWRPVVGIDAFDLREDEIDITPWLPWLCDGNQHTFEIRVAGINDDGKGHGMINSIIGNYWVVTGKIFVWLDTESSVTSGSGPYRGEPQPVLRLSSMVETDTDGTNETLKYEIQVKRYMYLESIVNTSKGFRSASWQQSLNFSNIGSFTSKGNVQIINQQTTGTGNSSSGYSSKFSYPMSVRSAYALDAASGNLLINGTMDRSKNVETFGTTVFPAGTEYHAHLEHTVGGSRLLIGSNLRTRQNGTATYFASDEQSFGFGSTEQDLSFVGLFQVPVSLNAQGVLTGRGSSELYHRHVVAVNGTVVENDETPAEQTVETARTLFVPKDWQNFAKSAPQAILGRGPPR